MPEARTRYYLRLGNDSLDEAKPHVSRAAAIDEFREAARSLKRFGQGLEASLYIAQSREELQDYPDFLLSLTARGGVKVTRGF